MAGAAPGMQEWSRLPRGVHRLVQRWGVTQWGPVGQECSKCSNSVQSSKPRTLTTCQADGKDDRAGPGLALHGPPGSWPVVNPSCAC